MKLFRRKETLCKETLYGGLVKYSHKTALENPEMIDREYEYKIQTLEDEIHEHQKLLKLYSFEVRYDEHGGFSPRTKLELVYTDRMYCYKYHGYISIEQPKIIEFVNVEPEVLLQAVEHNKNLNVQIKEKLEQKDLLKKERDTFKKTYMKKEK